MLETLHIRNLALIEDMTLEFSAGINVLTGETGAGKSFILKALAFVLGEKLNADIVRPGAEKAQVEALFVLDDREYIFRRELVASSGRSRLYINDSLSSQEILRELKPKLVSLTSQHAQQELLNPQYQAVMLERFLDAQDLIAQRDQYLFELNQLNSEINAIEDKQKALIDKRDLFEMQLQEIEKVDPKPGEEEELEKARAQIRSQTSLRQNYNKAINLLHGEDNDGLIGNLQDLGRIIQQMSVDDVALSAEAVKINEMRQHLQHLSNILPKPRNKLKKNSDEIEERLFNLAQLKRKLKCSFSQVLELKQYIKDSLSFLDASALDITRINRKKEQLKKQLTEVIDQISPLREIAAEKVAKNLETQLYELGFSKHAKIVPEFVPYKIWEDVEDVRGRIFWAPNPGQKPQPLDKIASGGELSRFLLALNTFETPKSDLTYIFDEVDAGVGGLTLNKVAEKLEKVGSKNQIILITHWPQLAMKAKKHFLISKLIKDNNTFTQCLPLDETNRKLEISRMTGIDVSAVS